MVYNKEVKLFFRFLKEKNIYQTYITQAEKNIKLKQQLGVVGEQYRIKETLTKTLLSASPVGYLSVLFVWGESKEGFGFWCYMDRYWKLKLSQTFVKYKYIRLR